MASPPVIVNHSVVRAGTSARASAAGLAAYAGTRRGVVIEVSEADGRRLGVDGLAAYAANRTGSTGGLWGADGPVPVAEARRAIAQNGGAVLTTVVTVPNDIAPDAGLDRLDAWQALVRSEWPRLFSEMTGVPESRVEFYAAMHINGTSHHVHILTVDREGDWDSLLPKGKMEAARLEISSKAMAPLLREAYIERDLAREAALDAVARIDRNRFDIELPPDGRIEAAHLRRFHPEASAALKEALDRAASGSPELAGALDRHRKAVERCAGLKCLTGEAWIGYTDVDSSGRGARDGRAVYEGPQAPEAFHRRVQEADSRPLQRRKAQARDHGRVRPRQEHRGEVDQVDKRDRLAARRGQPHARAEPDPGARAREPQAPDGGRRLKTSGADIRSKVRAIAANEGRYPISAQCRLLGVARSTYYSMRSRADRPDAPDPAAPAVVAAHAASKGRYGSRKIKASLERSGVTVSRRRVCRIMRENGLVSAYGRKRFKVHPGAVNEADVPNVVARGFGGRAPRTHICSDLTYVRVGASWNYVCLLVDLYNREIVGHSAGPRKDARLVKSAFATLSFPISDIEVFHTDRGSEFDNAEIDLMLEAFGIERSLSAKGCPYDNAVDESTNRILKAELVHRETFGTTRELRAKLSDYVHWYNNFRIHSTLGYMSPVEFREAGLSLPESSK